MTEADGLQAVFMANRGQLLRFLNARGAREEAEDLLQELWVKTVAAPAGPIEAPLPYLYRMADNLLLDRRRATRRRAHREEAWGQMPDAGLHRPGDIPTIERTLIAREQLATIEAALAEHGRRTMTIFRRHRMEGVRQRQIAAEMGLSLSLVEKELQKAYRAIVEARRRLDADSEPQWRPGTAGDTNGGK